LAWPDSTQVTHSRLVIGPSQPLHLLDQATCDWRGRVEATPVTTADANPKIDKAEVLRQDRDITFVACGVQVIGALAAAETRRIVTTEAHHVTGGLGGAVAEFVTAEHPTQMRFVGMPDEFCVVGSTARVRQHYGLDAANIIAKAQELVGLR